MIFTNRTYKDSLFRKAFERKEDLLALYNAVNNSSYEDAELLEIRTLDNAVYVNIRNDAAFILDDVLSLYEHQSTVNPNMPIRALGYFASLYQTYIDEHKINVFSKKLQHLPFPQYVVFYNGKDSEPDCRELHLSDAFLRSANIPADRTPGIEIRATVLNINWGHNHDLLDACHRLREYSRCIATIRSYEQDSGRTVAAVTAAIEECIEKGYLADILSKNKSEVISLFLIGYDDRKRREFEQYEAREEGLAEGLNKGWTISQISVVCRLRRKGMPLADIADTVDAAPKTVEKICQEADRLAPDCTPEQIYEALFPKGIREADRTDFHPANL